MIILLELEREYGIAIARWERIRDVYRLFTVEHGVLCLKSFTSPEREVEFIVQILKHINEAGMLNSPNVLATLQGSFFLTRDNVHYMLSNWVIGEQPDFRRKRDFNKAVRLLARFHSLAQDGSMQDPPEGRILYGSSGGKIASYQQLLNTRSGTSRLQSLCEEALLQLTHPMVKTVMEQEQSALAFVHGDYNYPNLVLDSSRTLHMIDFDNTSLNCRMLDLSHLLHRNFPWRGKEMLRWVDYYDRKRPLSAADLHLLYALLLVPYPYIRQLRIDRSRDIAPPGSSRIRRYKKELKELL